MVEYPPSSFDSDVSCSIMLYQHRPETAAGNMPWHHCRTRQTAGAQSGSQATEKGDKGEIIMGDETRDKARPLKHCEVPKVEKADKETITADKRVTSGDRGYAIQFPGCKREDKTRL